MVCMCGGWKYIIVGETPLTQRSCYNLTHPYMCTHVHPHCPGRWSLRPETQKTDHHKCPHSLDQHDSGEQWRSMQGSCVWQLPPLLYSLVSVRRRGEGWRGGDGGEGMKEGGGEKEEQTAGGCLNASSQIESL